MKNGLTIIIGLLFLVRSYGIHDSVEVYLNKLESDTARVDFLVNYSWKFIFTTPDTAIKLCNKALQLANKMNYEKGKANSYNYTGIAYDVKGDTKNAESNFLNALESHKKRNDSLNIAKTNHNLGIFYKNQAEYKKQ